MFKIYVLQKTSKLYLNIEFLFHWVFSDKKTLIYAHAYMCKTLGVLQFDK